MKKTLLLIAILILQASCSSTSKSHDDLIGQSRQKLIKTWGPPVRILYDDQHNEIFLYADQVFITDSGAAGPYYWKYDYMYINKEGNVYSWRNEKQKFPPQAVESKDVVILNTQVAK